MLLLDAEQTPKLLGELMPAGAQWLGLRIVRERSRSHSAKDGHPEGDSSAETAGAMVEVMVDGQFAYAATADVSIPALKRAASRAASLARASAPFAIRRFPLETRSGSKGSYASAVRTPIEARDFRDLQERLLALCRRMKISDGIVRTEADFTTTTDVRIVSTSGADIRQAIVQSTLDLAAIAKEGSVVQRRTDGGWSARSYQAGLELLLDPAVDERAERIARQALELVAAQDCPTKRTKLLVMPDQMMLQIHESIGHPLELDRILGDERNYAGSSFVKLEDFGKLQYGSRLMNVTFDPTVADEFASYAFDDTGTPASREYLIREGQLVRGLGGRESQLRADAWGVANQRACSWNRPPIDRMANINLEPGDRTLEQLVSGIEEGVLMEANRSWSIDDYRNKFQFGCEYAREIRNGRLGRVLKNPNYRGITVPFWNSLVAVGDGSTTESYGTPLCGKGEPNQSISVGHRSPACVFDGIEVFGGEA